jgi:hypothetical protein
MESARDTSSARDFSTDDVQLAKSSFGGAISSQIFCACSASGLAAAGAGAGAANLTAGAVVGVGSIAKGTIGGCMGYIGIIPGIIPGI